CWGPRLRGVSCSGKELRQILALLFDHMQPASPFILVIIGPERFVTAPKAGHLLVGLPVFERGLYGLRQRRGKLPAGRLNDGFRAHVIFSSAVFSGPQMKSAC